MSSENNGGMFSYLQKNILKLNLGGSSYQKDKITSVSIQHVVTSPVGYSKKRLYCVVTYESGFQIFDINNPKKPEEIVSQKTKRVVDFGKVLSIPSDVYIKDKKTQSLTKKYPLFCIVTKMPDNTPGIQFYSLKLHKYTDQIAPFRENIREIHSSSKLFIVVMKKKMYLYNPLTFQRITKFQMFPNGSIALSKRWIAFPSISFVRNKNLILTSVENSFTDIAKKAAKGLLYLGDLGSKKIHQYMVGPENAKGEIDYSNTPQAGTIEIRDVESKKLLCHFKAHTLPISAMQFDSSGTMLVTSSTSGTHLNVYRILPRAYKRGLYDERDVQLVYKLIRGFTSANIRNIEISVNSKWIAATSARGTTHIFSTPNEYFEQMDQEDDSLRDPKKKKKKKKIYHKNL